ncbi:ribonuclease H-like domain-containing protein [Tanacetum coccineum]
MEHPSSKKSFYPDSMQYLQGNVRKSNPEEEQKIHAIIDSGFYRSMTETRANSSYLQGVQRKIVDENLVLLRAPRKNDVYSLNLKSIIPSGGVTCLVAKASKDEAILWHRRLGHVNFKNINKLVKSNLVRVDSWVFFLGLTKNEDILHTSDLIVLRKQTKTKSEDHQDVAKDRIEAERKRPEWMFDLDILSPLLNYIPVRKENQVDTAVKQSNLVDFDDVDDQQFIVHGSSPIGNKAVSAAITNDAQNKDSDESTVVKKFPLTIEDQDLQKEFENLMLQTYNVQR